MTNKGGWLFWTNCVNALLGLAIVGTGVLLKWGLPPGSGGGRGWRGGRGSETANTLMSLTRHEWRDVHFWLAVAMVAGIVLHLLLHYGWIKASARRYLFPRRSTRTGVTV